MPFNFRVRAKNPYFWVGLIGVMLSATGADPTMFTDWHILLTHLQECFGNPFLLGTMAMAVLGVFFDPTTKGICDSKLVMSYEKPKG